MLVLSRKESERIRLGDSIVVTVVKIAGDKVRVGIEAPADILVLRDELQRHERPGRQRAHERGQTAGPNAAGPNAAGPNELVAQHDAVHLQQSA